MRRLAVERAAGPHIMRHIGDRDDDMPAAAVLRVVIRLGPHRIVEIARILAVDRDQREVAQIGAAAELNGLGAGRFGQRLGAETRSGSRTRQSSAG